MPAPFDPAKWAMALLAVLVVGGMAGSLMATAECTFIAPMIAACIDKSWGQIIRDWLTDTMPVLVAIIMRGSPRDRE